MEHLPLTISSSEKPEQKKCAKCEKMVTPHVSEILGIKYPKLCAAHAAEESAELAAEIERKEKQEKIAYCVKRLGMPPKFQGASFENFKKELQPVAFQFASSFAEGYKPGETKKGLYLFGQAGSGKTHLAASIGNRLVQNDVRFTTAPEFLLDIKRTFNIGVSSDRLLDALSQAELLILDDLGSEKPTEWVQEILFVLIDRRYVNELPTIYTSNLSLDQLKERLPYKIASRIAGTCEVVEMKAGDYRIRKTK